MPLFSYLLGTAGKLIYWSERLVRVPEKILDQTTCRTNQTN